MDAGYRQDGGAPARVFDGPRRRFLYLPSLLLVVIALLIVPAVTMFELFSGVVSAMLAGQLGSPPLWKGLIGLEVHTQIAAAVSSDTSTFANKLVSKIFEIVLVLLVSGVSFLAGLLAFKAIELPAGGSSRFAQGTRWLTARFYDHRVWMLGIGWFSLLVTIMLFGQIPGQFQPTIDDENSQVEIEMVPGTTLAETKRVVNAVADRLREEPEVERLLERIRQGDNSAIFVRLRDDRKRSSIEFERDLAPELSKIPDARVRFRSQSGGFGSGRDMTVMLAGSDPQLLDQTASQLVEQMRGLKTLVAPRISADLRRPEIIITPRVKIAAELGVTTAALSQTIRIATLGEIEQNAARFSLSDRQIPIVVRLSEEARTDFRTIEKPAGAHRQWWLGAAEPGWRKSPSGSAPPRSSATTRTAACWWALIWLRACSRARHRRRSIALPVLQDLPGWS